MTYGVDTSFLVAAEVAEHADHIAARNTLTEAIWAGDTLAIAPQVLAEFIHVVTDNRRFANPLGMPAARDRAERWWTAREVTRVMPDDIAVRQFLEWLKSFTLGRKRLLDTLLAATYYHAGISSILTTNPNDFATFGVFNVLLPGASLKQA